MMESPETGTPQGCLKAFRLAAAPAFDRRNEKTPPGLLLVNRWQRLF
ncbi:MAG: hypothetical protein KGQ60_11545 [Planctomycetes bacterium]|nr:hypothetical protein [Planctomycetota bacterium]